MAYPKGGQEHGSLTEKHQNRTSKPVVRPGDQATSRPTTTDAKWGQFRPSRWGQCKSSFRPSRTYPSRVGVEWGCRRRSVSAQPTVRATHADRGGSPIHRAAAGCDRRRDRRDRGDPDHKDLVRWLYVVLGVAVAALAVLVKRKLPPRAQARAVQLKGLLLAPFASLAEIDPTQIGVDAAAERVLEGDDLPEYLRRTADDELRMAVRAALDDRGRWIVVAVGPSKTGKSRALFEALRHADQQTALEVLAPVDADALRSLTTPGQVPKRRRKPVVLWLDDLEPFVNQGVTLQTLRQWRGTVRHGLVAATVGGKGSELVAGSPSTTLATLAGQILQHAREIPVQETAPEELAPLRSRLSYEALASIKRHGLAAYLVAAPALERKLSTRRHAPGEPESPEGVAIVYAAVDWARCGRTDPMGPRRCVTYGLASSSGKSRWEGEGW